MDYLKLKAEKVYSDCWEKFACQISWKNKTFPDFILSDSEISSKEEFQMPVADNSLVSLNFTVVLLKWWKVYTILNNVIFKWSTVSLLLHKLDGIKAFVFIKFWST